MKIGIGVISYNRPKECLEVCKSILSTLNNKTYSYKLVAAVDQEDISSYSEVGMLFPIVNGKNGGVAVNKNRALFNLKECDLVFLFEDDFKPVKPGWVDLFITAIRETGMHHYNYIRLDHRDKLLRIARTQSLTIGIYERNTAQLMVMDQRIIELIGAFDERYGKFGYEHSDYTRRCKNSGLCGPRDHGENPFIFESDLYFKDMGVKPCFGEPERLKYSEEAHKIYMQYDPRRIYIPFPKELK